jgi:hypothetical protein
MKYLAVLFLLHIQITSRKVRANDGDPAPGRSPGPPINDVYSQIEVASHEHYQPSESTFVQEKFTPSVDAADINRFSDILSTISRENVEVFDENVSDDQHMSVDEDDGLKNFNARLQFNEELALNALKIQSSDNGVPSSASDVTQKSAQCTAGETSAKVVNYVRRDETDLNHANEQKSSSSSESRSGDAEEEKFEVDVTHDAFSTLEGLMAGVVYKGKRNVESSKSAIRIMLLWLEAHFFLTKILGT